MALDVLAQGKKAEKPIASRGMQIFLLIWFGQMVSLVGSGMTCFAQSVTVYTDMGGTITNLGVLAVLAQLPGILMSPIAGVLADRVDRRWMMIVCDTVAAMATLSLRILIVTGVYQIWHIYVITVIISIANHFQWPAYFASVSTLVPKQNLGNANGLVGVSRAMGQIAAPFMAGIAVTFFRLEGVILFDLATYLFALTTLLVVRFPKLETSIIATTGKGSLLREALYGWKYLISRPGLVGLLGILSVGNFVTGGIGVLLLPLAIAVASTQIYGSVMSIGGISMLLGSLVMGMWGGPRRRIYGVLGFAVLQGLAVMLVGFQSSIPVLFVAAILYYFAVPIVNACSNIIWQTKVPHAAQGRVLAASIMATALGMELGILAVGPLIDYVFKPLLAGSSLLAKGIERIVGTGPTNALTLSFLLFGALYALVSLSGFLYPRLRSLEKEMPDAISDEKEPIGAEKEKRPAAGTLYEFDLGASMLSPSAGLRVDQDKDM